MYGFEKKEHAERLAEVMRARRPEARFLVQGYEWREDHRMGDVQEPLRWGVYAYRADSRYKGGEAGDGFIGTGFVWFENAEFDFWGVAQSRMSAAQRRAFEIAGGLEPFIGQLAKMGERFASEDVARIVSKLRRMAEGR